MKMFFFGLGPMDDKLLDAAQKQVCERQWNIHLSFYLFVVVCHPKCLSCFVYICLKFYLSVILSISILSISLSFWMSILFVRSVWCSIRLSFYFCLSLTQLMYSLSDVACFSMLCSYSHKCPILSGSLSDWCWL